MKLFPLFLLLIFSSVNAGVYKWTDKKGKVHYSDHPVSQAKATELTIDIESSAGIANSSGDTRERNLVIQELEEDRKAREKNRQEKRITQKKKQQRCVRSEDNLRHYRNASAIYKLNSKGERIYYSREERKAREKKLQQSIAKNCR